MTPKTVVFWDIDGTLLTTARAGIFAWEEAVQEVCRVEADLTDFRTSGLTDAQIAALLIEHFGSDENADDLLRAYERRLPASLPRRDGRVLPRVAEILEDLSARDDVFCVLLTGNTPAGAQAKLEHFELARFFEGEGAFCLGPGEREQIARHGYSLAASLVGGTPDKERLYVVGDTPHDIRCGQAIGARTIAVASGTYAADELASASPWLVLEGLPSAERFGELLGIRR